jgi:hypothetical protein
MKITGFLLLAFVAISCVCHAQTEPFIILTSVENTTPTSLFHLQPNDNRKQQIIIPGRGIRRAGKVLTLAGSILFMGGVAVVADAQVSSSPGNFHRPRPLHSSDLILLEVGVGSVVTGIILWHKGNKKYREYTAQNKVSLRYGGNGLSLCYRL